MPREEFVLCTDYWQHGERPRIFVRSNWLNKLHLRGYSVFALIDAIGVKAELAKGTFIRPKLNALRARIDEIAARNPAVAFISFADSLLLMSIWFVGKWDSEIKYTYEPEAIIRLLPEINAIYDDIFGLKTYAIVAQGINEYCDDGLMHISKTHNHVSLNSLGLPFAQLMAIDEAVRHAGIHQRSEVYMDRSFFLSLRFKLNFHKSHVAEYVYVAPMVTGLSYYYATTRQNLLSNFESLKSSG